MSILNIDHPAIGLAIRDLQRLLSGLGNCIEKVELFGSTLVLEERDAHDIDLFISYRNIDYRSLIDRLGAFDIGRSLVLQHVEMGYNNHPTWEKERPIPLHLLFYADGITRFPAKLARTHESAVDVTDLVFDKNSEGRGR